MEKFNLCNRRYLGNKTSLLPLLNEIIEPIEGSIESVCDLFSGTGVVGEFFLKKNKNVIFNDILFSNITIYNCFFGKQMYSETKIIEYINFYNEIDKTGLEENYFSDNFADTYFSYENCKKIGYIREHIAQLLANDKINQRENDILVTALIYAIDKIANTVGHYDAYRENKEDLNREINIKVPNLTDINNDISVYRENANDLVRKIQADLIYIDPPYNSRQYCDMYHLLENLAEWKKPKVFYKAKKMDRRHIKSLYSMKNASEEFRDLIENINSKYIIVSYNDTGEKGNARSSAKISDDDLINILKQKGDLKIYKKEYNTFTTGKSDIDNLSERFFVCKVKSDKVKIKEPVAKAKLNEKFIKTPLNYTGGKYKLLDSLTKLFPKDLNERTFIDLFAGGLSVGINVEAKKVVCNDIQKSLIRLYKLFEETETEVLLDKIENLIIHYGLSNSIENGYSYYNCNSSDGLGSYNKEKYSILKKEYNDMETCKEKDYLFFLLIVFGFNNQIRFNSKNEFNMPVGKRDFNKSLKQNLINTVEEIKKKNIYFISEDFRKINIEDYEKPFIYCDPPYILTTASYNENNGWNTQDELDLLNLLKEANEKNIKFALSNVLYHSNKEHTILLNWAIKNRFNIIHLNGNYKNSSYHKKDKKTDSDEVLITNYY